MERQAYSRVRGLAYQDPECSLIKFNDHREDSFWDPTAVNHDSVAVTALSSGILCGWVRLSFLAQGTHKTCSETAEKCIHVEEFCHLDTSDKIRVI